ncbi:MAG: histidine triad nucleotide-binding protein [Gemmatimonadales bacterium]
MADCLFCKIAAGEIPVTPVKRSNDLLAFRDINPQAPTHVLVIPMRHYTAVRDAGDADGERMLGRLMVFTAELAAELGLDAGGYRIVTNTGADAGQSVGHLHLHLLGGRKMAWPPG